MKTAYIIVLVIIVISIIASLVNKMHTKKTNEKFNSYYSKVLKKNELIMAINDYENNTPMSDYLIEINEVHNNDERSYMKILDKNIDFGRSFSKNEICIFDEKASEVHFDIFLEHNIPFIKCLSKDDCTKVVLKRQHHRHCNNPVLLMKDEKIELFSGDAVLVGERKYVFTIWHHKRGIK